MALRSVSGLVVSIRRENWIDKPLPAIRSSLALEFVSGSEQLFWLLCERDFEGDRGSRF